MFDFGQTQDGRLFMTMEFLDGMSLRDALQRGPLAPQRVVKVLIQCCASLAEAHSIGIIHRDIKPDNVFLLNMAGSPDFVKLLDFSVAKLLEGDRMKTQAGVVFGTPQYMSPEQGRGLPLDARSDLYALGMLAYEMLVGTVPYNDDNPMAVIQMQRDAAVPPMPQRIPYSVQMIVRRALEKDPARRYQSSGEMMQHCQQVFAELNGGGVSVGGGGVPRTMIAPNMQAAMGQPPPGMQQPQAMGGLVAQQPDYQAAGCASQDDDRAAEPVCRGGMPGMAGGMPRQSAVSAQRPATGLRAGVADAEDDRRDGSAADRRRPAHAAAAGMPQGMQACRSPCRQPGGGRTRPCCCSRPTASCPSRAAAARRCRKPAGAHRWRRDAVFWAVSLIVGIALGVVAYVIVLQV